MSTETATAARRFFPASRTLSRAERSMIGSIAFAFAGSGAIAMRLGPTAFERWASGLGRIEQRIPMPRLPAGTTVEPLALPNCPAELVRAPGVPAGERAVLYLHGGGFLGGGTRTYRPFAMRLSRTTGATVLNVDYRLLPRGKVRDAIADGLDGYRRLLEHGYDPGQILVAGDSAGGHLAFSVPLKIIEERLPAPAAIVAISPWLDFDPTAKRAHANARLDPMIYVGGIDWLVRKLIAEEGRLDPLLSPVNGELAELPPSLIQVGSGEVLLVDAELMAERLEAAGVPCELQVWEHQIHCFQVIAARRSQYRAAMDEIGRFVEAQLSR